MDWQFELQLAPDEKHKKGKRVVWRGKDGEDAAYRYEADHPGASVVKWRNYPRHGLFIGVHPSQIDG
jgi:hypothetical protein